MSALPAREHRRTVAERLSHLGITPKFPSRLKLVRSLPREQKALSADTFRAVLLAHISNATPRKD